MAIDTAKAEELIEALESGKSVSPTRPPRGKKRGRRPSQGDPSYTAQQATPAAEPESVEASPTIPVAEQTPPQEHDWSLPASKRKLTIKGKELMALFVRARKLGIKLDTHMWGELKAIESRIDGGGRAFSVPTNEKFNKLLRFIERLTQLIMTREEELAGRQQQLLERNAQREQARQKLEVRRQALVEEYGEDLINELDDLGNLLVEAPKDFKPNYKHWLNYCERTLRRSAELLPVRNGLENARLKYGEEYGEEAIRLLAQPDILLQPVPLLQPPGYAMQMKYRMVELERLMKDTGTSATSGRRKPHANRDAAWRDRKDKTSTAGPEKGPSPGAQQGTMGRASKKTKK